MSTLLLEQLDALARALRRTTLSPLARLEGCGVRFLCSPDVSIRRAA